MAKSKQLKRLKRPVYKPDMMLKQPEQITFFHAATPVAKGRPRGGKNGVHYTPTKTFNAEATLAMDAIEWMKRRPPISGPVEVRIEVVMPLLKSWSKKKRAEMIGAPHVKRPDADNLQKLVMDALQGVVFADDSTAFSVRVVKRYGVEPGFHIDVCNYEMTAYRPIGKLAA